MTVEHVVSMRLVEVDADRAEVEVALTLRDRQAVRLRFGATDADVLGATLRAAHNRACDATDVLERLRADRDALDAAIRALQAQPLGEEA